MVVVERYAESFSYSRIRKDCRVIGMPDELDLHGQRYRLGGIMEREGESTDSGHYFACVHRKSNLYKCCDSVVHRIKSFPEQSCEVYLLFFIKLM